MGRRIYDMASTFRLVVHVRITRSQTFIKQLSLSRIFQAFSKAGYVSAYGMPFEIQHSVIKKSPDSPHHMMCSVSEHVVSVF